MLAFGKAQINDPQMSFMLKSRFLTDMYRHVFEYNQLVFRHDKFKQQDWNQFFPYISKIHNNYLQLQEGFQSIPQNILFPSYTKLKTLVLADNLITSIEAAAFIDAPNLSMIDISVNLITSVKALSKAAFQVEYLEMRDLRVKQFSLSRSRSKKQMGLYIELNFEPDKVCNQDISLLAKLQCDQLNGIGNTSRKRIPQKRVKQALQLKHNLVKFV